MVDVALEKRAGNNEGVITALYPRIKTGQSRLVQLPKGPSDTVLWKCPDDVDAMIGAAIDFFNGAAVPAALNVDLILKSPPSAGSLEHPLFTAGVPAFAAGVTGLLTVPSPFIVPFTLTPGEELILRISDPTYLGGCVVEASIGVLHGCYSVRKAIGTTLAEVIKPPPGKTLAAINAGLYGNGLLQPIWMVNSDSVNHNVTLVVEENGVDVPVLQGLLVATGSAPVGIPYNSVASGQVIKMLIEEPIVTPGKSMTAAVLYMLVDEPAEDLS